MWNRLYHHWSLHPCPHCQGDIGVPELPGASRRFCGLQSPWQPLAPVSSRTILGAFSGISTLVILAPLLLSRHDPTSSDKPFLLSLTPSSMEAATFFCDSASMASADWPRGKPMTQSECFHEDFHNIGRKEQELSLSHWGYYDLGGERLKCCHFCYFDKERKECCEREMDVRATDLSQASPAELTQRRRTTPALCMAWISSSQ